MCVYTRCVYMCGVCVHVCACVVCGVCVRTDVCVQTNIVTVLCRSVQVEEKVFNATWLSTSCSPEDSDTAWLETHECDFHDFVREKLSQAVSSEEDGIKKMTDSALKTWVDTQARKILKEVQEKQADKATCKQVCTQGCV